MGYSLCLLLWHWPHPLRGGARGGSDVWGLVLEGGGDKERGASSFNCCVHLSVLWVVSPLINISSAYLFILTLIKPQYCSPLLMPLDSHVCSWAPEAELMSLSTNGSPVYFQVSIWAGVTLDLACSWASPDVSTAQDPTDWMCLLKSLVDGLPSIWWDQWWCLGETIRFR